MYGQTVVLFETPILYAKQSDCWLGFGGQVMDVLIDLELGVLAIWVKVCFGSGASVLLWFHFLCKVQFEKGYLLIS